MQILEQTLSEKTTDEDFNTSIIIDPMFINLLGAVTVFTNRALDEEAKRIEELFNKLKGKYNLNRSQIDSLIKIYSLKL